MGIIVNGIEPKSCILKKTSDTSDYQCNEMLHNILFFFVFFLRKTGPELTSMPIFLYFICGTPASARLDKRCHVLTQDLKQRTPGHRSGTFELNC